MAKARTLNPYDMESRINDLENGGGGGGASIITQHIDSQTTDGNGVIFLDLNVDDYILLGVTTKDFSVEWGPLFQVGCWKSGDTFKYTVKLFDMNGQPKASSHWEIDITYMARPTA